MSFELEEIATALRLLRVQRDLTKADCARRSGLTTQVIGSWKKGRGFPVMASLRCLFSALECDFRDLQDAIERLRRLDGPREERWSAEDRGHPSIFGER